MSDSVRGSVSHQIVLASSPLAKRALRMTSDKPQVYDLIDISTELDVLPSLSRFRFGIFSSLLSRWDENLRNTDGKRSHLGTDIMLTVRGHREEQNTEIRLAEDADASDVAPTRFSLQPACYIPVCGPNLRALRRVAGAKLHPSVFVVPPHWTTNHADSEAARLEEQRFFEIYGVFPKEQNTFLIEKRISTGVRGHSGGLSGSALSTHSACMARIECL